MNRLTRHTVLAALIASGMSLLGASAASAQGRNDYGEVQQTVARISYLSGDVSFARGDDPDNWQPADWNVPMTLGDRIYTGGRSRVELQIQGGAYIWIAARTDLGALNLTEDTRQFSLKAGLASFNIRRMLEDEVFEVDTPNSALTFDQPGQYRVSVDEDGTTTVFVRRGSATIAAGGGQIGLRGGDAIEVYGLDRPQYAYIAMLRSDGWDRWVEGRMDRFSRAGSYRYVSVDVVGADDLDDYGRWEDVPQYGRCWTPTSISVGWAPYRVGHWIWQDPWGWTWVSAEPWGWAPYHYGRWVVVSSRWYWVPVAPRTYVTYSPALVAFVGGGPGWSVSFGTGGFSFGTGGYVGWFPLAPRDPFIPWWERRASVNVNVTNVTYVNKTYVTVVNQNTFVSGGVVTNRFVQDRSVVAQVASAPVLRGPVPVMPTREALHVAGRTEVTAAPRPPAAMVQRAVVARVAPPPAPPSFEQKLAVIRENRGAAVAPHEAAQISVENRGRARAVTEIKPVAPQEGQVVLSPRGGAVTSEKPAPQPVPIVPMRGRSMSTTDRPVATSPVTGGTPQGEGPRRQRVESGGPPPTQPPPPSPPPERGRERIERFVPPPTQPSGPPEGRGRERIERGGPPPTQPPPPTPEGRGRERIERFVPPPTQPPGPPPEGRGRERIERGGPPPTQPLPPTPEGRGRERIERGGPPPPPTQPPGPPPEAPARGRERREPPTTAPPPPQPPGQAPPGERVRREVTPEGKDKGKEKKDQKEERGRKPEPTKTPE